MLLSVICQLLSTFERSGCSKGKQTLLRCSSVRLLWSAATSVSDLPVFVGAFAACAGVTSGMAAATAMVDAAVFRNSRRVTAPPPSQSGQGLLFMQPAYSPRWKIASAD